MKLGKSSILFDARRRGESINIPSRGPETEHFCLHKYTIEDSSEGTAVCTSCGLVIDDICYSNSQSIELPKSSNFQFDPAGVEFIRNVCSNMPMLESCTEDSICLFKKLSQTLRKLGWTNRSCATKDIAAYAIYKSGLKAKCGITPQQIHRFTDCEPSQLRKIEVKLDAETLEDYPSFHLGTLCYDLDVPKHEESELRTIMDGCGGDCFGAKPYTTAVAMIHLYSIAKHSNKLPLSPTLYDRVDLQRIAKRCFTNTQSIKRVMSKVSPNLFSHVVCI